MTVTIAVSHGAKIGSTRRAEVGLSVGLQGRELLLGLHDLGGERRQSL